MHRAGKTHEKLVCGKKPLSGAYLLTDLFQEDDDTKG